MFRNLKFLQWGQHIAFAAIIACSFLRNSFQVGTCEVLIEQRKLEFNGTC